MISSIIKSLLFFYDLKTYNNIWIMLMREMRKKEVKEEQNEEN